VKGRGIKQGKQENSIKSLGEAKKAFKEQNPDKNILGVEFQTYVNQISAADPSFDFSS
jgi:hypothetical protein